MNLTIDELRAVVLEMCKEVEKDPTEYQTAAEACDDPEGWADYLIGQYQARIMTNRTTT